MLSAYAASLAAVTSAATTTARRHATVTSTAHPGGGATRDRTIGHAAGARDGAGALVGDALVAVPACDEEHGRTIGDGSNNSSSGNSCTGGVDLAAGIGVATNSTAITSTPSGCCGGVASSNVRATSRKRATGCKRTSGVDQVGKVVDSGVFVVPEWISRVTELSCKLGLQVLGDGEHCHGGDETLVLCGVERLQSVVLDISDGDVQTISDSLRQVVEDLVTTVVGRHEWVVQGPLEAHLTHEAIL